MSSSPAAPRRPTREEADAIAARAAAQNGAAVLWWIVGSSLGSIPLAGIAVMGIGELAWLEGAAQEQASPSTLAYTLAPTVGLFVLALVVVVALIQLAIHVHRRATYGRVRRMLDEGSPHLGRIVQARRISMTQSRVSVQGVGFAPFDDLLATNLPDAALVGREVTVYMRPGTRMILPFD